jgi:transposase
MMVWGGIHSTGFGQKMYCDIFQEGILGSLSYLGLEPSDIIFQQDNNPKHTSRVAQAWIEENLDETLPWLPNSPDMNIIEHVWDILGVRVQRRNPRPTNTDCTQVSGYKT